MGGLLGDLLGGLLEGLLGGLLATNLWTKAPTYVRIGPLMRGKPVWHHPRGLILLSGRCYCCLAILLQDASVELALFNSVRSMRNMASHLSCVMR